MVAFTTTRAQQFRVALAYKRMTAKDFAKEQGISAAHLSFVLSGKRNSNKLTEVIDRFIKLYYRGAD